MCRYLYTCASNWFFYIGPVLDLARRFCSRIRYISRGIADIILDIYIRFGTFGRIERVVVI